MILWPNDRVGSRKKGERQTLNTAHLLNNMNKLQSWSDMIWSPIRFSHSRRHCYMERLQVYFWEAQGILQTDRSQGVWNKTASGHASASGSDSGSLLMASSIQATAGLHWWAAAFLHATSAGSTLVVADALVDALVTRALYQVSHTGGTAFRVTLTGHAALCAREACSTGAATLVQCTVKCLPSTMLPHTEVLLVGACTTFTTDLLIFVLFHQSIMVVHLFHATQLIQFPGCQSDPTLLHMNHPPPVPPKWIPHLQQPIPGIQGQESSATSAP